MPIEIRRAGDRFRTRLPWLDSSHCFSFGPWHDPANTHHGVLVVSNDDVVHPTSGSTPTPTATWRSSPGCSTANWSTATPWATPGPSTPAWPSA